MSALFLELDRFDIFLSSPLAPHAKIAKSLPVVRLQTKKLLFSVDAVVGLKLLATTLVDKHMANVLPNYVLVRTDILNVQNFTQPYFECKTFTPKRA